MTDPSQAPSPVARELTLQEWFDLPEDEPGELVDGRLEEEEVPDHIAIEILSPRARDVRRDRVEKKVDYAAFGVRWYWIVDPEQRSVEINELGSSGAYACVTSATVRIDAVPGCDGLALDLPALWEEIEQLGSDDLDAE